MNIEFYADGTPIPVQRMIDNEPLGSRHRRKAVTSVVSATPKPGIPAGTVPVRTTTPVPLVPSLEAATALVICRLLAAEQQELQLALEKEQLRGTWAESRADQLLSQKIAATFVRKMKTAKDTSQDDGDENVDYNKDHGDRKPNPNKDVQESNRNTAKRLAEVMKKRQKGK